MMFGMIFIVGAGLALLTSLVFLVLFLVFLIQGNNIWKLMLVLHLVMLVLTALPFVFMMVIRFLPVMR